jgi:hypothetical protein
VVLSNPGGFRIGVLRSQSVSPRGVAAKIAPAKRTAPAAAARPRRIPSPITAGRTGGCYPCQRARALARTHASSHRMSSWWNATPAPMAAC